jgi:hypothetical protein
MMARRSTPSGSIKRCNMHNGKMFPLWLHGEAQTPGMEHYPGLFTDEYMDDWRHKIIECEVPVEE